MKRSCYRMLQWAAISAGGGLMLDTSCLPPNFYSDLAASAINTAVTDVVSALVAAFMVPFLPT